MADDQKEKELKKEIKQENASKEKLNETIFTVTPFIILIILLIIFFFYLFFYKSYFSNQELYNETTAQTYDPIPKDGIGNVIVDPMTEYRERAVYIETKDGRKMSLLLDEQPNYSFIMPSDGTGIGFIKVNSNTIECFNEEGHNSYFCGKHCWVLVPVVGNEIMILNSYFPATCMSNNNPGISVIEPKIIFRQGENFLNKFEFIALIDQTTGNKNGDYMIRKAQTNSYLSIKETVMYSENKYSPTVIFTQNQGTVFSVRASPQVYETFGGIKIGTPFDMRVSNGDLSVRAFNPHLFVVYIFMRASYKLANYLYTFDKYTVKKFQRGKYTGFGVTFNYILDRFYPVFLSDYSYDWRADIYGGHDNFNFFYISRSPINRIVSIGDLAPKQFFRIIHLVDGIEYFSVFNSQGEIHMKNKNEIENEIDIIDFFDATGYKFKEENIEEDNIEEKNIE